MNRSIPVVAAFALALLGMAAAVSAAGAVPARAAAPASRPAGADESVVIVLRHQYSFANTPAGTRQRMAAAAVSQAPVLASLRRSGAAQVTRLPLIDAIAATVSPQEDEALSASPSVAEVAPNTVFGGPPLPAARSAKTAAPAAPAALTAGVCPAKGKVKLEPEGVELVHAVAADAGTPTARKLGFTGAGVTVGNLAVGINPDEPEMIRPDGQHVIAVYKDFTGEGTAEQGGEDGESYLDDSILAAQGRRTYDLHDYTPAMPAGCDIRLQGVAPGITIDDYKVYANNDMTTLSSFVEAIDYAVDVSHVDVLNEESGQFPFPDDATQDVLKQANEAAMAAGVTITSPSYDAGPENTIWSPSSQPGVISVGASTAFRSYAQEDMGDYTQLHARGWVSDNVSSLSSGGATEDGRSIDVVAPGDSDWIACQGDFAACAGEPLSISGGTSEAGPLTAGVAALVIQAYRSAHHGASPSVSLVRDIISSSADDLGLPGSEQGAGLVDAYRAVKAALAAKAPAGPALVASAEQLDAVGSPGAPVTMSFELTNDGSQPATVSLGARTQGAATTVLTRTMQSNGSLTGQIFHFPVAHGAAVLTADVADPGGPDNNPVAIALANPNAQLVAYSFPQGAGDHGQAEVRDAAAGTWTADLSSPYGGYYGPVRLQVSTSPMTGWGSVSPSCLTLAAGAKARVTLSGRFPSAPGDESASVTFSAPGWGSSSLPVTLRSLVPITGGAGRFATTLAGGNGRFAVPAQTFFYNFDVPAGEPALDVQAALGGGNHDPFWGYLVDPHGSAVAMAGNQVLLKQTPNGAVTDGEPGARLHTLSPPAGRWTLILTFTNPVTGNALRTPLSGRISFAPVNPTVRGLPDDAAKTLVKGGRYAVTVTVHNSGDSAESYFLDGRLDRGTSMTLQPITPAARLRLPQSDLAQEPQWIVPAGTTALRAVATSSAPTTFDFSPFNGDPDTGATVSGDDASATLKAPAGTFLTQGDWDIDPQRIGPFGARGAARSMTTLTLTATTAAFDPALTASTGDLWRQGAAARAAFKPVLVRPGQTTTIHALLIPAGRPGSVVSGILYLDDATALGDAGPSPFGDQLVAIPYRYRVG